MKKLFFALLLLLGTPIAFCQVDTVSLRTLPPTSSSVDTTPDVFDPDAIAIEEDSTPPITTNNDIDEVISSSNDINFSHSIQQPTSSQQTPKTPIPLYSPYSKVFLETKGMIGPFDVATGLQAAYVENRWGIYGSYLWGLYYNWMNFGAVLRPITGPAAIDWQLYAGPTFGRGIGFELGTRFAGGADSSPDVFSWVSASMSIIQTHGEQYFTCGLSLDLSGLMLLFFL